MPPITAHLSLMVDAMYLNAAEQAFERATKGGSAVEKAMRKVERLNQRREGILEKHKPISGSAWLPLKEMPMRRRRCRLSKANSQRNRSPKAKNWLALSNHASHRRKVVSIQIDLPMITCKSHTNRNWSDRALNYFQPYLAFISSWISSNGLPRPGFFRASSARRSSSAICSGVSSSSYSVNSSKICWTSSRRSFSGMSLMRSRISPAVMAGIYSVDLPAQAGFSRRANSSFVIRHLSLFNA